MTDRANAMIGRLGAAAFGIVFWIVVYVALGWRVLAIAGVALIVGVAAVEVGATMIELVTTRPRR